MARRGQPVPGGRDRRVATRAWLPDVTTRRGALTRWRSESEQGEAALLRPLDRGELATRRDLAQRLAGDQREDPVDPVAVRRPVEQVAVARDRGELDPLDRTVGADPVHAGPDALAHVVVVPSDVDDTAQDGHRLHVAVGGHRPVLLAVQAVGDRAPALTADRRVDTVRVDRHRVYD